MYPSFCSFFFLFLYSYPINIVSVSMQSQKESLRLSPSAIACYYECQRKFFYRYIKKIPERPTPQLIRGRIAHKVLENFFNFVSLVDIKHDDWEKLWKDFKNGLISLLNTEWNLIGKEYIDCFEGEKEKKEYYEETKRFLDFYAAKLAFSLNDKVRNLNKNSAWFEEDIRKFFFPRDRELKLVLEEENFSGIIDKTMSLFDDSIAIVDYKTSKSALPHYIPDSHLKQGKSYAYLWKKHFDIMPKHISFYYLRTGESVFYPISERDIQEIENDIVEIRNKKQILEEFPKNPTRLCTYCDFFGNCFPNKTKSNFLKEIKN